MDLQGVSFIAGGGEHLGQSGFGTYVQRWARWVRAGLGALGVELGRVSPSWLLDCKT